jgi:hypothetical protein
MGPEMMPLSVKEQELHRHRCLQAYLVYLWSFRHEANHTVEQFGPKNSVLLLEAIHQILLHP